MKTVTSPNGQHFKMGRVPSRQHPRLSLSHYLDAALPAPPATGHYSRYAEHALTQPYLNTELGDCVVAAPLHAADVFVGGAGGAAPVFTDQQVVELYSAIGGYDASKTSPDGSNPTDQGCDIQTMLRYWQNSGLVGHKIRGWVAVKPEQARTAMWLFENLIFGFALPDAWLNPMPAGNGYTWDDAGVPNPDNGHCFCGVGWNTNGVIVDSWGLLGTVTYAAVEKYGTTAAGGELYTVLSDEAVAVAAGKALSGFDVDQLQADLAALSHSR